MDPVCPHQPPSFLLQIQTLLFNPPVDGGKVEGSYARMFHGTPKGPPDFSIIAALGGRHSVLISIGGVNLPLLQDVALDPESSHRRPNHTGPHMEVP